MMSYHGGGFQRQKNPHLQGKVPFGTECLPKVPYSTLQYLTIASSTNPGGFVN